MFQEQVEFEAFYMYICPDPETAAAVVIRERFSYWNFLLIFTPILNWLVTRYLHLKITIFSFIQQTSIYKTYFFFWKGSSKGKKKQPKKPLPCSSWTAAAAREMSLLPALCARWGHRPPPYTGSGCRLTLCASTILHVGLYHPTGSLLWSGNVLVGKWWWH